MVKGEEFDFPLPERLNLGAYFLDRNLAAGRGDNTAIYYRDQSLSFAELWRLTNRVGNALKEIGVEPENRVLLILEDQPDWAAAWLATMKIGAVGTHAYTYLPAHDYAYLLDLVRPKAVVADATTLARVREAAAGQRHPKAIVVVGEAEEVDGLDLRAGEFALAAMVAGASDQLEVEPTHRDDIAFWNFSGGTTGKPKGVPHSHIDGAIGFETFDRVIGYGTDDIVLRVPKLFFHYSRDHLLFPLRRGAATILFGERTTAALIFELIAKHRPTMLVNVPTMMRAMIQIPAHERTDLSCLRHCMSSGELLSAQLYGEWVDAFGGEVINRFGSAESAMGYLCNHPGAVVPGSSGTVTPLAEIKLVDEHGGEVAPGQPGVLHVRCPSAGLQYVREHDKSKATFLGGGWIDTGDLFTHDENGYFWLVGRANEMVKVSGVWVSPLEIERGLQECPGVAEAAALAMVDADGLTAIGAFVVLEDGAGASAATAEELKRYCKQALAPHKYPSHIEFMNELPKTGQGKIDRRRLRVGAPDAG